MKSVALGQYYPVSSPIHRIDPRAKVILAILYIVCSFLCENLPAFGALTLSAVLLVLLSRIPLRVIWGGIKPIVYMMLITAFINLFFTKGETVYWAWGFLSLSKEGIYNAIFMALRIVVLVVGSCLFLTYTTTPIALTDALEQLLAPLKLIHFPVHDGAMMMTIALRFIPTLVDETDKIMSAQKARGADFTSGNLIKRIKALIPVLVPLLTSAFRRADELSTAMICRCYNGGTGRTRMTKLHFRFADAVALLLMVALGVGLVFLSGLDAGYTF